ELPSVFRPCWPRLSIWAGLDLACSRTRYSPPRPIPFDREQRCIGVDTRTLRNEPSTPTAPLKCTLGLLAHLRWAKGDEERSSAWRLLAQRPAIRRWPHRVLVEVRRIQRREVAQPVARIVPEAHGTLGPRGFDARANVHHALEHPAILVRVARGRRLLRRRVLPLRQIAYLRREQHQARDPTPGTHGT